MPKSKKNANEQVDKVVAFGKKLFAGILRSRSGSLSEMSKLLRFQTGTKGFHRQYNKLLPILDSLKSSYKKLILEQFPDDGLLLGIIDDTFIEKIGKMFPKYKIDHDHNTGKFVKGMRILSTMLYKKGKLATISSEIVGKGENKLDVAKEKIDELAISFLVDVILFDSWYCKSPVLQKIEEHGKLFVSRLRADSSVVVEESDLIPLNILAEGISHNQYEQISIAGKSYWVCDLTLEFKTYGELRVIVSKEGQYEKPIFLTTNAENFSAQFVVKLYLKRFMIEVFFKDSKQFLNLETFFCRPQEKWDLHLTLVHILHWASQKRKSISKTVRKIRESIKSCLLFINQNHLIEKIFEETKKLCQT